LAEISTATGNQRELYLLLKKCSEKLPQSFVARHCYYLGKIQSRSSIGDFI
jgi:hypothetical protein